MKDNMKNILTILLSVALISVVFFGFKHFQKAGYIKGCTNAIKSYSEVYKAVDIDDLKFMCAKLMKEQSK